MGESIALFDADKTKFPNLALMKISAWHKSQGDSVGWYGFGNYDKVYASKVFTFTKSMSLPSDSIKGGTGFDITKTLPEHIEHICPDYDLYGADISYGFTTRGCINKCPWCIVPRKEGGIRGHADVDEFLRHKKVILMDNNPLACDYGIDQIDKLIKYSVKVDYNQGLDAKMINPQIAKRLSKLKWLKPLRMSCDTLANLEYVKLAASLLRAAGVTPRNYFCYVLVKDVAEALHICEELKAINIDPFAQPYLDYDGNGATKEQKDFARWVNHKATFKSVGYKDYKARQ